MSIVSARPATARKIRAAAAVNAAAAKVVGVRSGVTASQVIFRRATTSARSEK